MMGFFKSMAGLITLELTSADVAGSLSAFNIMGVPVFSVSRVNDLTVQFEINRRDFRVIQEKVRKKGDSLRVISRKGIYWHFRHLMHRPVITTGLAALIALSLWVPGRVFFVRVDGNETIPSRRILEAAENCGINFGASRRAVRSEKVKNALLSDLPGLQWAGVNTNGCTAVISVREREDDGQAVQNDDISSIAASRDGIIISCTVTRGNGLCTAGQAVKEGQILISSYTDCGLCITSTRAEGEILAQTQRNLQAMMLLQRQHRGEIKDQITKLSLIIGKNRINFYKGSGIYDASCGKMYSKYVLSLPGGFDLPIALVKETTVTYDCADKVVSEEAANVLLKDFSSRYLQQQMIAGNITGRSESMTQTRGAYCMTGVYACTEMIGRRQQEEIGELHEAD